jgi:hypothetical protein
VQCRVLSFFAKETLITRRDVEEVVGLPVWIPCPNHSSREESDSLRPSTEVPGSLKPIDLGLGELA